MPGKHTPPPLSVATARALALEQLRRSARSEGRRTRPPKRRRTTRLGRG